MLSSPPLQWHDDTHDATPSTAVGGRGARASGRGGTKGGACSVFEIDPSRNQFHATFPGVGTYEGPLIDIFYFDRNRAEYPLYQGGDGGQSGVQSCGGRESADRLFAEQASASIAADHWPLGRGAQWVPHGSRGRMVYEDGDVYEGAFVYGRREGRGIMDYHSASATSGATSGATRGESESLDIGLDIGLVTRSITRYEGQWRAGMREDSRAVIHWQHPDKQDGKGKHGGKAAIGDGGHRRRAMFEGDALTTLVDEAEEEGNGGGSSGGRGGGGGSGGGGRGGGGEGKGGDDDVTGGEDSAAWDGFRGDGQGGHGDVFAQLQFCGACTYLNEDRLAACSICGGREFVDEV